MEVALEQFISSDKSKKTFNLMKNISIALIVIGLILLMVFLKPIGFVVLIMGVILLIIRRYSYVDYEYELYNGNIDISKIYSCTKRKLVQKISVEDVESVYIAKNNDINKNGAKVFFNSNRDGLKVYTFQLRNNNKIQVALNSELEKTVKIIYRSKIIF
ncbi:DUF6106 family protein [Clostridium sp. SM-530-WT-3G]|uniref:DUF6106 family protein n=1 Tax=Clostridium sp. SM-530-WT-3G TaxID=2725303 RepID=UPI00145D1688|nr:DUF6106 family protein [Clostridium sp. SM-530-WT-3G]NME83898.1 hypothetical protein [Clostridium sp. SM-530-WT-3G]